MVFLSVRHSSHQPVVEKIKTWTPLHDEFFIVFYLGLTLHQVMEKYISAIYFSIRNRLHVPSYKSCVFESVR